MPKWLRLLLFVLVAGALALTAPRWFSLLFSFLSLNADVLQAFEAMVQTLLWLAAAVGAFFGWRQLNKGGGITFGGTVQDSMIVNVEQVVVQAAEQVLKQLSKPQNLEAATQHYMGYILD
ncbi:MAG: hypothetical protein JW862_12130, partial [Anaerolineales bacterium]|nr:hypothetical protein [Anaerolineales bacterium]